MGFPRMVVDNLVNLVTGLGTAKDPTTASSWQFNLMSRSEQEQVYRSNWLARRIVDAHAEDAAREWRMWQASNPQIEALEEVEHQFDLQRKFKNVLIRARLYGGAALVMGVEQGESEDELDIEQVGKDDLKFVVVLNRYELSAGPRIFNVMSPYYTRPEYYSVSTPLHGFDADPTAFAVDKGLVRIHPSRVLEFSGNELPDWRLAAMGAGWGDSVLQTCDEVLKDYGLTLGGIANMVNDAKMDIIRIPDLSKNVTSKEYRDLLQTRFSSANQMKSTINSLVLDKEEEWERISTRFQGLEGIMREMVMAASGAAGIPVSRLMGQAPGKGLSGSKGGGEQDMRNYYDTIAAYQNNNYGPILEPLDRVIQRSALGREDPTIYYEWKPLYQPDPNELADISLKKAQATQVDATTGLINEDALRQARVNQLIEDGTYPGLEDAIDEHGLEPVLPQPGEPGWQPTVDPSTGQTLIPKELKPAPPVEKPNGSKPPAPKAKPPTKDARWIATTDYRPDQARDPRGKWTEEGGGGGEAVQWTSGTGKGAVVMGPPPEISQSHWAQIRQHLGRSVQHGSGSKVIARVIADATVGTAHELIKGWLVDHVKEGIFGLVDSAITLGATAIAGPVAGYVAGTLSAMATYEIDKFIDRTGLGPHDALHYLALGAHALVAHGHHLFDADETPEMWVLGTVAQWIDQYAEQLKQAPVAHDAGFNPDEPRGEHGRWTEGGGSATDDINNLDHRTATFETVSGLISHFNAQGEIPNPQYERLAQVTKGMFEKEARTVQNAALDIMHNTREAGAEDKRFTDIYYDTPDQLGGLNKFQKLLGTHGGATDPTMTRFLQQANAFTEKWKPVSDALKELKGKSVKMTTKREQEKVVAAKELERKYADSAPLIKLFEGHMEEYKNYARDRAQEFVDSRLAKLKENDWDLNKVAPKAQNTWGRDYREKNETRGIYTAITKNADPSQRGDHNIRAPDEGLIKRYIDANVQEAEAAYRGFMEKMTEKIGKPVVAAEMKGDIWRNVVLTVKTSDDEKQVWHTKMILNFSKYNRMFNQFPSRRISDSIDLAEDYDPDEPRDYHGRWTASGGGGAATSAEKPTPLTLAPPSPDDLSHQEPVATGELTEEQKYALEHWGITPEIQARMDAAEKALKALPETINDHSPERLALRLKIADKLYNEDIEERASNKEATIILGLPGAGKSTIAKPLLGSGALEIDPDLAKLQIPEYNNGIGASAVHEESSDISRQVLNRALKNGDNIVWPRVDGDQKLVRDVQALKALGYKVHVKLIDVDQDTSIRSVVDRFLRQNRLVTVEVVKAFGKKPITSYEAVKHLGIADSMEVYKRDSGGFRQVEG